MKRRTRSSRRNRFLSWSLRIAVAGGLVVAGAGFAGTLKTSEGIYTVREHYNTVDRFGNVSTIDYDRVLTRRFPSTTLENELIRVTVVPDLGGRVVSLYDKEANREMLYLPEVVSPYGFLPPFYYNHLKVYGGIFLSVPGSEHGKAAHLPWEPRVIEGEDRVSLRVSWNDTVNIPYAFNRMYDRTGLGFAVTMTLYEGAKYLEYVVTIENPGKAAQPYEAWVATTVSDRSSSGSEPEPAHFVVPVDEVITKAESWPWVKQVEEKIAHPERDDLYTFDRLQYAENYFGYYIGNPSLDAEARWWAVVHPEDGTGLLCLRGNDPHPKGQKYWSWGYRLGERGSANRVPYYPKPYYEPWVGVSEEFGLSYRIGPESTQELTLAFYPLTESDTKKKTENVLLPSRAPEERLRLKGGGSFPPRFTYRYEEPYDPDSVLAELDRRIERGFDRYPADVISLLYQGGYYERAKRLIREYRTAEVEARADEMMLKVLLMEDALAAAETHFTKTMDGTVDGFVGAAVDLYGGWNDQTAKILHLDDYVVERHGRASPARVHVLDYLTGRPGFRNPLNLETRREILGAVEEASELGPRGRYYRGVIHLEEGDYELARKDLRSALSETTDEEIREAIRGYLERTAQDLRISKGELPEYRPILPSLEPGESIASYPWEQDAGDFDSSASPATAAEDRERRERERDGDG